MAMPDAGGAVEALKFVAGMAIYGTGLTLLSGAVSTRTPHTSHELACDWHGFVNDTKQRDGNSHAHDG